MNKLKKLRLFFYRICRRNGRTQESRQTMVFIVVKVGRWHNNAWHQVCLWANQMAITQVGLSEQLTTVRDVYKTPVATNDETTTIHIETVSRPQDWDESQGNLKPSWCADHDVKSRDWGHTAENSLHSNFNRRHFHSHQTLQWLCFCCSSTSNVPYDLRRNRRRLYARRPIVFRIISFFIIVRARAFSCIFAIIEYSLRNVMNRPNEYWFGSLQGPVIATFFLVT